MRLGLNRGLPVSTHTHTHTHTHTRARAHTSVSTGKGTSRSTQTLTNERDLVNRRSVRHRTVYIGIVERSLCHVSKCRITPEEFLMATWKDAEASTLLWNLVNVCEHNRSAQFRKLTDTARGMPRNQFKTIMFILKSRLTACHDHVRRLRINVGRVQPARELRSSVSLSLGHAVSSW